MKLFTEMPVMVKQGVHWERTVPFSMLNEEWAQRNHSQSLQRLAERGGLGPDEIIANIEKRRWRAMNNTDALIMITNMMKADKKSDFKELNFTEAHILRLQPNDVIVLRMKGRCSNEVCDLIQSQLEIIFPHNKALILEEGTEISIVRLKEVI